MEINVTIIFQIIHFFFAYIILRFFIFDIVVARVIAQKKKRKHIEQEVKARKEDLDKKIEEQKYLWGKIQSNFTTNAPLAVSHQNIDFKEKVQSVDLVVSKEEIAHISVLVVEKIRKSNGE